MESMQWTFVDKTKWPLRGEWDSEPDKMQWTDVATGLPCLIHRGPSGALCGYVGVAEGHKFFGVDYNDVMFGDEYPDVHGGLTFADFCAPETNPNGRGICHIPGPGEPDRVWWLGFDCAHCDDLCPEYMRSWVGPTTYHNVSDLKRYCARLAEQLAGA